MSMKNTKIQVQHIPLFKDLSPQECERVYSCLHQREFKANNYLFEEGQEALGIYIVLEGHVKVIRTAVDGKEVILFLVRPEHIVGEGAVFQKNTHPATAVAVKKVRTLFLSAPHCHLLVQEIPALASRLLAIFAARQRMFMHKIAAQGERNALTRVAGYILHRISIEEEHNSIQLAISRNDLANLLGLARETVSRQLSLLVECGAITVEGNSVCLVDKQKLQANAQGYYEKTR